MNWKDWDERRHLLVPRKRLLGPWGFFSHGRECGLLSVEAPVFLVIFFLVDKCDGCFDCSGAFSLVLQWTPRLMHSPPFFVSGLTLTTTVSLSERERERFPGAAGIAGTLSGWSSQCRGFGTGVLSILGATGRRAATDPCPPAFCRASTRGFAGTP